MELSIELSEKEIKNIANRLQELLSAHPDVADIMRDDLPNTQWLFDYDRARIYDDLEKEKSTEEQWALIWYLESYSYSFAANTFNSFNLRDRQWKSIRVTLS